MHDKTGKVVDANNICGCISVPNVLHMGIVPVPIVHSHYCYILSLVGNDRVTYIGYTINILRRLRQHNGELVGGARFTTRHGPAKGMMWRVVALVTAPDLDHRRGLSLEWHIKNPHGRRRRHRHQGDSAAAGRVRGMVRAMVHGKFADDRFTAWIVPEYRAVLLQAMVDASHMEDRCDVLAWPRVETETEEEEEEQDIDERPDSGSDYVSNSDGDTDMSMDCEDLHTSLLRLSMDF